VDVDKRDELYGERRLDGFESDVGHGAGRTVDDRDVVHIGVYRCGRNSNSNRECVRRFGAGTDADVGRFSDDRCIAGFIDVDVELDKRDELYGVRWLDGHEGDVGYTKHRRVVSRRQFHVGVYGRRRLRVADGNCNHCAAADGNADGVASDHCSARFIDVDVEFHECNELYRVGWLERHEVNVRLAEHWRIVRERNLYAQLFGYRRFGLANGNGDGCTSADSHADRVANQHCIR
jgi:hypothetical protein